MKSVVVNETGKRYGMLLVIERAQNISKKASWLCLCDCGNTKIVQGSALRSGGTVSCGCKNGNRAFGEACFNRLYINYKHNAINRGFSFNLPKDAFRKLTKENCFYCGKEPSQVAKGKNNNGEYLYNGVDRINPSMGYFEENVVSCCKRCNSAKHNFQQEDFYKWIESIYSNYKVRTLTKE